MEKTLRFIEKFIPKKLYRMGQPIYHFLLAITGAILYGFPAKKLYIVGVTGTKGKSSTAEIVNAILEEAGHKTALSNTIRFKIGDKSKANKYKMSMPGRFFMQKFLSDAVKAGCTHAVVEVTSEGSKQFRHKFIYLNAFIFTNLAPEHIEAHGSYEKYREAKLRIVDALKKKKGFLVINKDDKEGRMFLDRGGNLEKLTYSLDDGRPIRYEPKTEIHFKDGVLHSKLNGEFNVYNILAAATFADRYGIKYDTIKNAVEGLTEIPGRVQKVEQGQDFDVVVDYAHTPESLEELYKAFPNRPIVCVLGNCGGGRDRWKRPIMARIAEKYCSHIILTNEDPYDEDPEKIINEMAEAIKHKEPEIIMDRREAINKAIRTVKSKGAVLISGKGTDPYIMGANGEKTPWSDYKVASEELGKVLKG